MTKILLLAADGPESIEIYTSEVEGIIDWSPSFPALYVKITLQGVSAKFGPFTLSTIYNEIIKALKENEG